MLFVAEIHTHYPAIGTHLPAGVLAEGGKEVVFRTTSREALVQHLADCGIPTSPRRDEDYVTLIQLSEVAVEG